MTDALRLGRVELRPGFIVIAAVGCLFAPSLLLAYFLAAAALHELGHVAALTLLGGRVERLRLAALGMELECDRSRLSYPKELAVYLAGPLASAVAGVAAAWLGRALAAEPLYIFAGASLLLGAFNLLPARNLDGGGALRVLSLMVFDREVLALKVLHVLTAAALAAFGLWATTRGAFNAGLLWVALWMLVGKK